MLTMLTMPSNRGPIRLYLRQWGKRLKGRAQTMSYEMARDTAALPDGAFIFGDVDRLRPAEIKEASAIWDDLSRRGSRVRLLNRPGVTMTRHQLLLALYAAGINPFTVYGLDEPRDQIRYPVFLRDTIEHMGSYSELLYDAAALAEAEAGLIASGMPRARLLIVEFADTSVDGLYRKYSAMKIGDAIIPQHVFFGEHWMVKGSYGVPEERRREDLLFLKTGLHPDGLDHLDDIRRAFDIGHIDFGRMDYAMKDGRLVVWEINTVPHILIHRGYYKPDHMPEKLRFARDVNAAFRALDPTSGFAGFRPTIAAWRDIYR